MSAVLIALVVLGALVLSAGVGYPLTVLVLRGTEDPAPRPDAETSTGAGPQEAARDEPRPAEVLRGGSWIGILERLAITGSILVGYPAAIAVVIAIKGLGRFPELHMATGVSERFIIGTLTSALWAAAVGVGADAAVNALG